MPLILAKSSRRKSRYRTGLLTRCEIVSKRCLLVLNLQKRTAAKALQMRRLSAFAFEAITLWNFEKKMNEANASVKRNTRNTIKQLMSKLAMKMQGESWSSNGGVLLEPNVWYVKVNLHSIRFSYIFVRFFTFLLLLEKVCAFSSAFL